MKKTKKKQTPTQIPTPDPKTAAEAATAEAAANIAAETAQAEKEEQMRITRLGHPGKPTGEEGAQMLRRMNESHFEVTGWALSFWTLQARDRVLDIGCGGGMTLRRLAEQLPEGHLTGVDYSDVSVAVSRETNADAIARGQMEILSGSVEKLPFPDESFDKIITVESFYFWPDPAENLKEVCRVLKKGGRFLLVADVYNTGHLGAETLHNIEEFHLFNPTKEEFGVLLEQAGFTHVTVHTDEEKSWVCAEGTK